MIRSNSTLLFLSLLQCTFLMSCGNPESSSMKGEPSPITGTFDCTANQNSDGLRPSLKGITHLEDLYQWKKVLKFTEASVSKVPLAQRAPVEGPTSLAGIDLDDREWQYDNLSTLWSQGGCGFKKKTTQVRSAEQVFNFKYWQYIDIVYYFGHQLVTIPPAMWTNAAHRNGVLSLGSINGGDEYSSRLLLNDEHLDRVTTALIQLAQTLQFDGYLFNFEFESRHPPVERLQILLSKLKESGLTVIWFDSPISGGYSNFLNPEAIPFLTSAGFFQSFYNWGIPGKPEMDFPKKSHLNLKKYGLEDLKSKVFQTASLYYHPPRTSPLAPCIPNDQDPFFSRFKSIYATNRRDHYFTSIGLYAPHWTMFGGDADAITDTGFLDVATFEQSDAAFWEGSGRLGCGPQSYQNFSFFINPRTTILQLPFYSDFNTGVGKKFFSNGKAISHGSWSNFSLQSILPTWQNIQMSTERTTAEASFDYEDAFQGGSSLKIHDSFMNLTSAKFRLFKTDLMSHNPITAELIVKYPNHSIRLDKKSVQLILNHKQGFYFQNSSSLPQGWEKLTFTIPPSIRIEEIGISVSPNAHQQIHFNLGAISIYNSEMPRQLPMNLVPIQTGDTLVWTPYHPGSTYRVYGKDKKNKYQLLNAVAHSYYDLNGSILNGHLDKFDLSAFLIQEVTAAGDFEPLADFDS